MAKTLKVRQQGYQFLRPVSHALGTQHPFKRQTEEMLKINELHLINSLISRYLFNFGKHLLPPSLTEGTLSRKQGRMGSPRFQLHPDVRTAF